MKRYMLFAGNTYYPAGGMRDFQGSHDSLLEALRQAKTLLAPDEYGCTNREWAHIYDLQQSRVVAELESRDGGIKLTLKRD